MRIALLRSVIVLAIVICFVSGAALVFAAYQQHRAALFLRDFVALRLGASTFAEAQVLAEKYGATSSGTDRRNACSAQDCAIGFVFKNWLLDHLQHKREISLAAGLFIKDGRVTGRELDYSVFAFSPDHQFAYVLFDRAKPENDKGYVIRTVNGNVPGFEIELGSNAPEEIRHLAYSIDLACLSKFTGCDSLSDILPIHWPELEMKVGTPGAQRP